MKKHRVPYLLISLFALLGLLGALLPAINAGAQTSSVTFKPNADAYVNQSTASTNYGSSKSIRVDDSPIYHSYLRFSVGGLNGGAIQSAKLRVYANSEGSSGYSVATASNDWKEDQITYSNAPKPGGSIGKTGKFNGNSWTEVDVSSAVKGEGQVSFVLSTSSSTNVNLASRESGGNAPQLVVSVASSAPSTNSTATPSLPPATQPATAVPVNPTQTTASPTQASTPTTPPPAPQGVDLQPSFPIRAAFYYPWFPEAWTQKGINPYTNYTPTLGYYSDYDIPTIKQHIAAMQYGNIQAGISSWWGQGQHTDVKFANLLSAAAGTSFRWAIYYENESQGDPSASQIQNDLTYIRDRYGKDPSFLRVNGKFVVFVYTDGNDTCGMADRWKQGNTVGAYVVLKVFPGYGNCSSQPDSWHQYSPAVATDSQGSYSYTISPGFWLKGNAVRLGRDLNRWISNVKSMVTSGAKWQLVTTFNEWGEGTIVESAKEWASASGYGAYLDVLHNNGGGIAPAQQPTPTTPPATAIPTGQPTPGPTAKPTTQPTSQPTVAPTTPPSTGSQILLVASDIAKYNLGSTDYTANAKKTGDVIRSVLAANPSAIIQTIGDNVNNDGGSSAYDNEYNDLYTPTWGSFLNRTYATLGNHDTYPPSGTQPFYNYFTNSRGVNGKFYYSYDLGSNWHIIVLNAQCSTAGGCGVGSPQYNWLKADLAANSKKCVLAAWHQPRWTSGRHADDPLSAAWWDLLYQYKADVVIGGHNHNYERFNMINPSEQAAADGIREFIVGTGGAPADGYSYSSHPLDPNEAVRNQTGQYGVLQFTLKDGSYDWNFLPAAGSTFTDSGSQACH